MADRWRGQADHGLGLFLQLQSQQALDHGGHLEAGGQALLRELATKCDIRWRTTNSGPEALRARLSIAGQGESKLVYCSITAYGQDGPYAQRPGYDLLFRAEGA